MFNWLQSVGERFLAGWDVGDMQSSEASLQAAHIEAVRETRPVDTGDGLDQLTRHALTTAPSARQRAA